MNQVRAVVVGAGPGGLGAAVELAKRGIEPLLLDENPKPGGQIYKQAAGNVDASPLAIPLESYKMGKQLLEEANGLRGSMRAVFGATVFGIFENKEVAYSVEGDGKSVFAESILLSLGAHDRVIPFPGWTLPGVVSVGGLQTLLKHHGVLPGEKVVLAGSGLLTLLVAAQMTAAGRPPAAVIEATGFLDMLPALPGLLQKPSMLLEGMRLMGILRRAGVRLLRQRAAIRALGGDRVERVEVAPVDSDWTPDTSRAETLETDCLAIGFGLVPEVALLRLAGCQFDFRPELGGWAPRYGEEMETDREGVFVAGDCCGIRGAEIAQYQGRLAGIAMAERLGVPLGAEDRARKTRLQEAIGRRSRARRGLDAVFRVRPGIYQAITGDTLVCRCEEVTWAEIQDWLGRGVNSPTQIKMASRAGMGRCQGRFCSPNFRDLLAAELGAEADLQDSLTARPPVKPVALETFAKMTDD